MSKLLNNILSKVFGSKANKDRKELVPYVKQVNDVYASLANLTHDELRAKSLSLRKRIQEGLSDIDQQIKQLIEQADQQTNINAKAKIFEQIDKLKGKRDEKLEEVLNELLPEAFAVIKDTARRFKDNETISVNASEFDIELSETKEFVNIGSGTAVWNTTWKVMENDLKWNMLHYDVQIIGGVVLHQGKIAEMQTGEGKTLVATFPAFLNGLAGEGVHLVTVNDYLAKRDCEWMSPLFQFHGLTIDCIDNHSPNTPERRKAYNADITYGTNNEFGFDYLRDNMVHTPKELVQRKHHFAMIDEVDSVLIDDARTPLIISGPVSKTGQEEMFYSLRPKIKGLVDAQKGLITKFLTAAKKGLKSDIKDKEAALSLFRAFRGLPKSRPLIKFLGEPGVKVALQKSEAIYLAESKKLMPEADEPLYFTIEEKSNQVELTKKGIDYLTSSAEDANFFIMPDIGMSISKIDNSGLSDDEKVDRKEVLIQEYTDKSERIHTIRQLLKAYCLFEKDTEYLVVDDKVKIVDESTGRTMEGRRYSDGLHQALEAKEDVKIEASTQTYATISLQNYFRMYHKLSGMTGTAETEAGEFHEIYKLNVVVIPTNRPILRDDKQDLVYKTVPEKFNAVAEEIQKLVKKGQPVLVGTTSVEISELLSRMLNMRKIKHEVLNAKQHQREAEIVAIAGHSGNVTIATNMAGRGTDIKLTDESKKAGGLAIIGTERHESRRVDRQLRGRAGRQGDPGSSQFFVSLDDSLMRLFIPDRVAKVMDKMGLKEGEVIQHSMVTKSIENAQKKVEENNFAQRKRLLEYDDVVNIQRKKIYNRRRHALFGERLELDVNNMLKEVSKNLAAQALSQPDNFDNFALQVIAVFGFDPKLEKTDLTKELAVKIYAKAYKHYKAKNIHLREQLNPVFKARYAEAGENIKTVGIPFVDGNKEIMIEADFKKVVESESVELIRAVEKSATLAIIDQEWKEHLREIDELKQSVQMVVHEQKDPLIIYKEEAFKSFERFVQTINTDIISFLVKANIPITQSDEVTEAKPQAQKKQKTVTQKEEVQTLSTKSEYHDPSENNQEPIKHEPRKVVKIANRNQRVAVKYTDGKIVRDVKFKTVEDDLNKGFCEILND